MKIVFKEKARKDIAWFNKYDKNICKKIDQLVEDIKLHPFTGLGKPEALKHGLSGYWSRRINLEHRLIYKIEGDTIIIIASCRYHYE